MLAVVHLWVWEPWGRGRGLSGTWQADSGSGPPGSVARGTGAVSQQLPCPDVSSDNTRPGLRPPSPGGPRGHSGSLRPTLPLQGKRSFPLLRLPRVPASCRAPCNARAPALTCRRAGPGFPL